MELINSGIFVIESPPRGQVMPVSRETVTAFIGPAPRGPVDMPVALRSVDEFLTRFGAAGHRSRLELLLQQYFDNGGAVAIVVRVTRTKRCNRIVLPGPAGPLVLDAMNPGPLEHLRASVDYEGIAVTDRDRFNLIIHRCTSPEIPLVEEQETFAQVSVNSAHSDFIADALENSQLVRLGGPVPAQRPRRSVGPDATSDSGYVFCHADWQVNLAPTDYDLIGSREEGTGLFALEQVPCVDLICLVPGRRGETLGPVALFAADRYARTRHAMLILDPPATWSSVEDAVRTQRERGFASPNALTYFPALQNPPDAGIQGPLSAAGAIAGMLAAVDGGAGPWAVPNTATVNVARGRPAVALTPAQVTQLTSLGVNALERPSLSRMEMHGPVTLARFGGMRTSWNDLRLRRTALFILGSIGRYTRWAAFEDPQPELWREVRVQVSEFLAALYDRGALAGNRANEAFYVKCDVDTNAGAYADKPGLHFVIGVALQRPAEFLAFHFDHTAQDWSVEELGWAPGLALTG